MNLKLVKKDELKELQKITSLMGYNFNKYELNYIQYAIKNLGWTINELIKENKASGHNIIAMCSVRKDMYFT